MCVLGVAMGKVVEEGLKKWGERGGGREEVKGREWKEGDRVEVGEWSRFRDDCIGLWRGTRTEFNRFISFMNSVDP